MTIDRKFLLFALTYAVAGMGLGIHMAASHDHAQHVSHAHLLLAGFVMSFIYAVIHRLWLVNSGQKIATAQFWLHHAGVVAMFGGLLAIYGNALPPEQIEPVLALSSLAVLTGMALMLFLVFRSSDASRT